MRKFIKKLMGVILVSGFCIFGSTLAAEAAVVVLDPGHGNGTITAPGSAVAPYYEAQLTIETANAIKSELEAAGVTVYLTRNTNAVDISLADRAVFAATGVSAAAHADAVGIMNYLRSAGLAS